MQEKKLNDDEIVKALECCKQKGGKDTCKYCYTCPASVWDFEDGITECNVDLFQKAINLIHRLQSDLETCSNIEKQEKETNAELRQEIERLTEERDMYADDLYWKAEVRKREDFITELTVENSELQKQVDELKEELEKAYEIELANIQAEIADAGTSCHWCERQTVKETAKEIYHLIDMFPIPTRKGQQRYATGFENGLTAIKLKIAERYGVEVE
jgi:DNA-binding transcriptional MerR regulator